jgi:hypothetical protein
VSPLIGYFAAIARHFLIDLRSISLESKPPSVNLKFESLNRGFSIDGITRFVNNSLPNTCTGERSKMGLPGDSEVNKLPPANPALIKPMVWQLHTGSDVESARDKEES